MKSMKAMKSMRAVTQMKVIKVMKKKVFKSPRRPAPTPLDKMRKLHRWLCDLDDGDEECPPSNFSTINPHRRTTIKSLPITNPAGIEIYSCRVFLRDH